MQSLLGSKSKDFLGKDTYEITSIYQIDGPLSPFLSKMLIQVHSTLLDATF